MIDDEVFRLRGDMDEDEDDISQRPDAPNPGSVKFACVTTTISSYPATANVFYACQREVVTGTETEGSLGVETAIGPPFLAYNLGTAVPASGTKIEVWAVDYRYVFRYGASS